jgi:hypothetical protein
MPRGKTRNIHKSRTRKNNRALNRSKRKHADINLGTYKKQLDQLSKVKYNANASEEDLEIYTINNRIIYLLLLKLLIIGTVDAIGMAHKYATKNKINLNKIKKNIPDIKSEVKKIKYKSKQPDMGSMSVGWFPTGTKYV